MSNSTEPANDERGLWRKLVAMPSRWSRLTREITLVLIVKTVLLVVIVKVIAPPSVPKPARAGAIEKHLLHTATPPAAAKDTQ